jgi:hypothetical protein
VIHLTMKSWVVIVGVALLVLAVSLAVLVVPSTSWAAALEWFTNPPHVSPCGCNLDPSSNG